MNEAPRLVPEVALPPYAYVPGGPYPHPTGDPRGHSYGALPSRDWNGDPGSWRECRGYLYGIDLFNHGYYWEAHETWEQLWRACERGSATERFLKGLIKLAAAGVKARQGIAAGVQNHAHRAEELFAAAGVDLGGPGATLMGFGLGRLGQLARQVAHTLTPGSDPHRLLPSLKLTPEA
jgi:hypothetical protein